MSEQMLDLYVICHTDDHGPRAPTKVGISKSAAGRIGTLQTASAYQLSLYEFWRMPAFMATDFEKLYHAFGSETGSRLKGEWHDVAPNEACEYVEIALSAAFKHFGIARPRPYMGELRQHAGAND